jgi:hypothetical protein
LLAEYYEKEGSFVKRQGPSMVFAANEHSKLFLPEKRHEQQRQVRQIRATVGRR